MTSTRVYAAQRGCLFFDRLSFIDGGDLLELSYFTFIDCDAFNIRTSEVKVQTPFLAISMEYPGMAVRTGPDDDKRSLSK
jgi:hypothetical protein